MNKAQSQLKITFVSLCSILLIAGCQTTKPKKDSYYWGEYESLIYRMYAEAGSAEADVQIEKLTNDIQIANTSGQKTPPGIFAHLGFMYASAGKPDLAIDAFTQEKTLFPESAKFIDGMMNRAFKEN